MISETTLAALTRAGWSPKRCIDSRSYEDALRAEQYTLTAQVEMALREFGGLFITYPDSRCPSGMDTFHFDPIRAISHVFRENVEVYEERVRERLVVIGEAFEEHMVLMIGESGAVYAGYDDALVKVGDTVWGAIETLCSCGDVKNIR